MPFLRIIPIFSLSELAHDVDKLQMEKPMVKKAILGDFAKTFYSAAYDNMHYITGQTRNSLKIENVTEDEANISAGFGALGESKRKGSKPPPFKGGGTGPHNWVEPAEKELQRQMDFIVLRRMEQWFDHGVQAFSIFPV
jgi:hypothetical protein